MNFKMKTLKYFFAVAICLLGLNSCKKGWLDAKPSKSLVVPKTVADYQSLLDNSQVMNINSPGLSMVGDGDFYVTDARYSALSPPEMGAYIWAPTNTFFGGQPNEDWIAAYARILNDNVVLDGLQSIPTNESIASYNNIKGSALFYRSFDFFELAQQYCGAYNSTTSKNDLGLPIRTSSDVNLNVNRSTVEDTYNRIIADLSQSIALLPNTALYDTRPSKSAAYALMSRVYMTRQDYPNALLYADSSLQIKSDLLNYNDLSASNAYPIPLFNKEIIFHCTIDQYLAFFPSRLIVDSGLYRSYKPNDLRTNIFYYTKSGAIAFKGSYSGSQTLFSGLATDEMYLNRAECYARAGKSDQAMNDLNLLLQNRYSTGSFSKIVISDADSALSLILAERRKELCFRGIRWSDLRRLNKDSRFAVTLTRIVAGQSYSLPPNSPKYVLPLDDVEVQAGLTQNQR
jgi:tetratricopeptide (TPR) repeat protein